MTDDKEPVMLILGVEYSITYKQVSIHELKYYPRNPRIAARISEAGLDVDNMLSDEMQEHLGNLMNKESSVKNLIPDIKSQDGVMDEILVNYRTHEVIEGNSRLAAMRELYKRDGDPDKWNMISCKLVAPLPPEAIDAYLSQVHVKGKTPWSAYEKANMAYQRIEIEGRYKSIKDYCKITSQTKPNVEKQIAAIRQMHQNKDDNKANFSFYDVLVRVPKISEKMRNEPTSEQNEPTLKQRVWEEIKSENRDFTALELRNKLPTIIESPRNLRKYIKNKETLHSAFQLSNKIEPIIKVKEATKMLEGIDQKHLDGAKFESLKDLIYAVSRCTRALGRVDKMSEKALKELPQG